MSENQLNPQPLPPGAKVDLGELTQAVTEAVRNALEARPATANTPPVFRNPTYNNWHYYRSRDGGVPNPNPTVD